jgi:mannitol/fructose-specific phosphotransferase system IIA component (Ntr-type)
VTAEELEKIVNPACVLMNVRASTFDECLAAFSPIVHGHPAIVDPGVFIESVRAREAAVSTATADHVAFPHARTEAVTRLFLIIGRSETGVSFCHDRPVVHLVFLIGAPPQAITDYLGCVAWLAKCVRISENRKTLMHAESPEAFLRTIAAANS